jgi:hypothetical protein
MFRPFAKGQAGQAEPMLLQKLEAAGQNVQGDVQAVRLSLAARWFVSAASAR